MRQVLASLRPQLEALDPSLGDLLRDFENEKDTLTSKAALWQRLGYHLSEQGVSFDAQHSLYKLLFEGEDMPVAWSPDEDTLARSNLWRTLQEQGFGGYDGFFEWAARDREGFWQLVIDRLSIPFHRRPSAMRSPQGTAEHPDWLPDARLNIAEACLQAPREKTAVVYSSEAHGQLFRVSYGALERLVNRMANGLVEAGHRPGEAVAMYTPLSFEAVVIYLGIVKAGMQAVLIADSFTPNELKRRAELAGAKLVFCSTRYQSGGKDLEIYQKVVEANPDRAVVIPYKNGLELRPQDAFYEEFLSRNDQFESVACGPYDIISVLFSSGTTKEPKAIPWTHLTPIKCASDAYFHHDVHPDDVVTWTTSMGWMMGPWTIFAALMNGATLALYTGMAAGHAYGHFAWEAGVSVLGTIPSLVKIWRKNGVMQDYLTGIRIFSSTGEPSNAEDYLYLMSLAHYQAPIIEYCGGTEIGGGYITGTVLQSASPSTFTTPALGMDLVLYEEGDPAPSRYNPEGQVFLVPPSIGMSERLLNRDHHQEYFAQTPVLPDGGLLRRHGDAYERIIASLDATRGMVFYRSRGRVDDAMNLGGVKVSAVEIEEVLNSLEMVGETAAVAVPQTQGGPERLVVFFVPAAGYAIGDDLQPLRRQFSKVLATEINPLFKVADVVAREHLPRTASNKLMRRALRREYEAQLADQP